MEHEKERTLYQLVAVGCFFAFIAMGWLYQEAKHDKEAVIKKYDDLKVEYIKASNEADKLYDRIMVLEDK